MKRIAAILLSTALAAAALPAAAQDKPTTPAKGAQPASQIITAIEKRPDFGYLETVRWNDDGYYEITYHTADKATVEIKIDAQTGQPRD